MEGVAVRECTVGGLLENKEEVRKSSIPVVVSSYSVLADGTYNSPANFRPFVNPPIPCDLNHGFETRVEREEMNIKEFIPLLKCIRESQIDLSSWDVLTFRNNLNKIMATPYSSNKWEIEIFKVHQFVFLGVISKDFNTNPKFVYWGYKFEQYCTATSKEELNEVVNPNNQTFIVGRTKIGQNRILFGAEMDSLEPNSSSGYNFIEIKTNRIIDNPGSFRNFQRHKLLSIWIQSYLAGVEKVFIGHRDDNGIVREVKLINTTEIPSMVNQVWDPAVCITFTNAVINMIKDNTQHNKQYTLSFDGFKIRLKESQREPFVPPEFLQHLESILNSK